MIMDDPALEASRGAQGDRGADGEPDPCHGSEFRRRGARSRTCRAVPSGRGVALMAGRLRNLLTRTESGPDLVDQLKALGEAVELCDGRIDPEKLINARRVVEQSRSTTHDLRQRDRGRVGRGDRLGQVQHVQCPVRDRSCRRRCPPSDHRTRDGLQLGR